MPFCCNVATELNMSLITHSVKSWRVLKCVKLHVLAVIMLLLSMFFLIRVYSF